MFEKKNNEKIWAHSSFIKELAKLEEQLKVVGLDGLSTAKKTKIVAKILGELRLDTIFKPFKKRRKVAGVNVELKI